MSQLTEEQQTVIHHPLDYHARVLAVAGSGKSTTMAHRIRYLVQEHAINPNSIQVLMFNALARKQFGSHLDKTGLPENLQPVVHTFHSFAFQIIVEAVKTSILPSTTQFWLSDKAELVWLTLKRAITDLEKDRRIPPDSIDPEEASIAISLWKGSLIPPHRAGSFTSPYLPLVYTQFEQARMAQSAVTYDDFIPMAVTLLEDHPQLFRKYAGKIQHMIVDEYQDINLGQQTLIELLSGDKADVMVVGDDDQTIYEWRGARPNYIITDFTTVFNGKEVKDYHLSFSFRFGHLIAMAAANVIHCNANRVKKSLVAYQQKKIGFIQVFPGGYTSVRELTEQVQSMTNVDHIPPKEIVVLSRLYAQMSDLEAEFLRKAIPYRVDGQEPFFKRKEINALLDYLRLARDFTEPLTEQRSAWLVNVANKPSRMLSRSLLERVLNAGRSRHLSIKDIASFATQDYSLGLNRWQCKPITELWRFLEQVKGWINHPNAAEVLGWMVDDLDYLAYFQDYYGRGENSDDKSHAVTNFIRYVDQMNASPTSLLERLSELDTTQGKPEDEQIVFTTIYRTKGLEFDYVLLPECDENMLPYLKGSPSDVYDTQGLVTERQMSPAIESERRLFYVALTRARRGVLIGTSSTMPSRFITEMQLQAEASVISERR